MRQLRSGRRGARVRCRGSPRNCRGIGGLHRDRTARLLSLGVSGLLSNDHSAGLCSKVSIKVQALHACRNVVVLLCISGVRSLDHLYSFRNTHSKLLIKKSDQMFEFHLQHCYLLDLGIRTLGSIIPSSPVASSSPPKATFFLDTISFEVVLGRGLLSAEKLLVGCCPGAGLAGRESTCKMFGAAPGMPGSTWFLLFPRSSRNVSLVTCGGVGAEAVPNLLSPSESPSYSLPSAFCRAFRKRRFTLFLCLTNPGCSQYGVTASFIGRNASLTGFSFRSTCSGHPSSDDLCTRFTLLAHSTHLEQGRGAHNRSIFLVRVPEPAPERFIVPWGMRFFRDC